MKKKIMKALAPEEQTIVANIQSLLNQLTGGSEESGEMSEVAEMAEDIEDVDIVEKEDGEDEEIEKGLEVTPSKGATAEDDFETVQSDIQPDETDPSNVAKAILALAQSAGVRKSASNSSAVMNALTALTMVVKKSIERQSTMEEVLAKTLDGLGVTKQLEIYQKEESRRTPVVNADNDKLLKSLVDMLKAGAPEQKAQNAIHKSLADSARENLNDVNVLSALLGVK